MADTCTCGTTLVEDAWFCHRCGKAQREILAPEPAEPEPYIVAAAATAPNSVAQPVGFKNAVALRIGFLTASVAAMLDAVSGVAFLFLIWAALAGFFAVMLYQRRTGQPLTILNGAKMGWITSVLNATIFLIFSLLGFAANSTESTARIRQQLSTMKTNDPAGYASVAPMIENPYGIAVLFLLALMMMFGIFIVAGTAGGALGAKLGKKD